VKLPSPLEEEGERGRQGEGETRKPAGSSVSRLVSLSPCLLVSLSALLLRLWGITWALPDQNHVLTYHPDEGVNLIQGVLERGQARPHVDLQFYNYGGLYFYLWQGAVAVNSAYGLVRQSPTSAETALRGSPPPPSQTFGAMLLVGRLLTAVMGALTAWAVWALGRRLYGERVGVVAGILLAIAPAAVVHGHYATVDVPATLFVAIALVYAAKLLESPGHRNVALAGLFSGLAAATKYNCGLVILAPAAALWLSKRRVEPQRHRDTEEEGRKGGGEEGTRTISLLPFFPSSLLLPASAAAGFLIGCPGVLVNPAGFWHDFGFELAKSREGMGLLFVETGNGWLYHLTSSMRFGLGIPLLLLCLAGIGLALWRRSRQDWLLLAFVVPYYLVIGWAQVRFLRYIIPLLPALCVLVGRLVAAEWPDVWARRVARASGAIVVVVTLFIALAMDRLFTLTPPQDQAYAWIEQNVPKGSSVGLVTAPWYYTPPFSPLFTAPATGEQHARFARQVTEYQLRPPDGTEWDPAVLQPSPPQYFVVSDIESEDARRIGWKPAQPFFQLFAEQYTPAVFENTPAFLGIDLGKPAYVPNDWLYTYPRITVYRRR
jgi:hypothetical protein